MLFGLPPNIWHHFFLPPNSGPFFWSAKVICGILEAALRDCHRGMNQLEWCDLIFLRSPLNGGGVVSPKKIMNHGNVFVCLLVCLFVCLFVFWLFDCLIVWLFDCCFFVWLFDCLIVSLFVWLFDCLIVWLFDCLFDCLFSLLVWKPYFSDTGLRKYFDGTTGSIFWAPKKHSPTMAFLGSHYDCVAFWGKWRQKADSLKWDCFNEGM